MLSWRALRSALPAVVLATIVLVPFLDKAFTIDDTFFLRGALQASEDPVHPTAFDIVWFDVPERAGPSFGPLMSWLLVPAVNSGTPEVVAHLVELASLTLALIATVALAVRLGVPFAWAAAAGIVLAVTPTVLGMAGTAMADVPAMALGVAGLERLVAWRQDRRVGQAILAVLCLGLAPLARPHAVLLLGVGGLLLVEDPLAPAAWRRLASPVLVPILGAVAVTAAVLYAIRDPSAGAPGLFGTAGRLSTASNIGPNLVAYFTHWGVAYPIVLSWLALRPLELLRRWWVAAPASAGAFLLLQAAQRASVPNAIVAGVGVAVVWDILEDAWRRRDAVQLTLGAWLLVPLVAVPYSHFPPKLNLLAAPGAAIIVARALAARAGVRSRVAVGLVAACSLTLGIAILRADATFAGLGRRASAELIAPRVAAGARVWFVGHWGFQWYAERAGARHVTLTPPLPDLGDFVIISRNCDKGSDVLPMLLRNFQLAQVGELSDRTSGGRHMTEGAGFFTNNSGFLPWTWGVEPADQFLVGRVVGSRWGAQPFPR